MQNWGEKAEETRRIRVHTVYCTREQTEGRTTRTSYRQHTESSGHTAKQHTDDTERGLSKKELTSVSAFQPSAVPLWTADLTTFDMEDYFFAVPLSCSRVVLWCAVPVPSLSLHSVRECSLCSESLPAPRRIRPAILTGQPSLGCSFCLLMGWISANQPTQAHSAIPRVSSSFRRLSV